MRPITHFEAEDGSLWPDAEAALNHERRIRGERASSPEIGYLVADVSGSWRAYKRVGGITSRLETAYGRDDEADDAFQAVLKDIGYPVEARYVSVEDGDYWPRREHFATGEGDDASYTSREAAVRAIRKSAGLDDTEERTTQP